MKVNTDGVLLGALMTVRATDRLSLDVGTGTGTVALMAAQRLSGFSGLSDDVRIVAIDIDGPSAREAGRNFAASPWPGMLCPVHQSLEEYRLSLDEGADSGAPLMFDHIFSNPPYYDMSLRAPDLRRNAARHTDSLSYRELIAFAAGHLVQDGILSLILPADSGLWLLRHARMCGLYPFRTVRIRTTPKKQPSRIVAEFSRSRHGIVPAGEPADGASVPSESLLTIRDGASYTPDYIALTRDFYLNF